MAGPFTLIPTEVLRDRNMQQVIDFGVAQTTAAAVAAIGTVPTPSYGGCYEFNEAGSALVLTTAGTVYQWVTGQAGLSAGATLVAYSGTPDFGLKVGSAGAGTYLLAASFSGTSSKSNELDAMIYKGAVVQDNLRADQFVAAGALYQTFTITGLIALVANDVVSMRFKSDQSAVTLSIKHMNLALVRLGP